MSEAKIATQSIENTEIHKEFWEIANRMLSEEMLKAQLGDIEESLEISGRELLKKVFQEFFVLQAQKLEATKNI